MFTPPNAEDTSRYDESPLDFQAANKSSLSLGETTIMFDVFNERAEYPL